MNILYFIFYTFLLLTMSDFSYGSPQEERKEMGAVQRPSRSIPPSPPAAMRPSVLSLLPTDMQSSNKVLYPKKIPYEALLTIFKAPMKSTADGRGKIASKVQVNVDIEREKVCVTCSHKVLESYLRNFIVVDPSSFRVIGGHLKTPVFAMFHDVIDPRRVMETVGQGREGYVSSLVKYNLYNQDTKEIIPESLFTMAFNFRES